MAVACADNTPAPQYRAAPTPAYQPAPAYKAAPAYSRPASYKEPTYADTPAVYNYQYAVADEYAGVNFQANEDRNNYATNGEYRVALPDGRTQIVTYTVADAYSGYVADVRYEGEAKYEPYTPKAAPSYQPRPVHKAAPAPAYKPAPTPTYKPTPSYSA